MRILLSWRKLAAGALLLAYTLILAEICVRILDPQPLIPRYVTGTPWGVRGNIPNATYRHRTPEVDVGYHINSQGMRADREFSQKKPAGLCRLAMLGDSFFVGYELEIADTIAYRLEKELKESGYHAEVLNFAVSGFGTSEMLLTYESYASKFQPDVVIFQWHDTDPNENLMSGLYRLDNDSLVRGSGEYLPSIQLQDALMSWRLYRVIADNSQLYSWARESAALFVKRMLIEAGRSGASTESTAATQPSAAPSQPEATSDYPYRLASSLLREAHDRVTGSGKAFLVVDIPHALSRTLFESSWDKLPAEAMEGIDVIRAGQIFEPMASPGTKLYYERGHGHITPVAAHALAKTLAAHVAGLPQLQACR